MNIGKESAAIYVEPVEATTPAADPEAEPKRESVEVVEERELVPVLVQRD